MTEDTQASDIAALRQTVAAQTAEAEQRLAAAQQRNAQLREMLQQLAAQTPPPQALARTGNRAHSTPALVATGVGATVAAGVLAVKHIFDPTRLRAPLTLAEAVNDARDDGQLTAATVAALQNTPGLVGQVLGKIRVKLDGIREMQAVTAATRAALPTPLAAGGADDLAQQLTIAMQNGGLAAGGESAATIKAVLGKLADKTGIAAEDLERAYTSARAAASASLQGRELTDGDYRQIMDQTLAGLDNYVHHRAATATTLEGLTTPKASAAAASTDAWNPFEAPAMAAEVPGAGGSTAAHAGINWGEALEGAARVAGGVMAVWAVAGAVQSMRSKDADTADKLYYGARAITGTLSAVGVANPFTAALALGATAAHLSREKTLAQLTKATEANHEAFQRLQAQDRPDQWAQLQTTAQLAACVMNGAGIKASRAFSAVMNRGREAVTGALQQLGGTGQHRAAADETAALQAYMDVRTAQYG